MRTADYDFELPDHLIARTPAARRDGSRLLVRRPTSDGNAGHAVEHLTFSDLVGQLDSGDLLVVNDTKVLPARFLGRRVTGARVELLFLQPEPDLKSRRSADLPSGAEVVDAWRVMARPAKKLRPGERVEGAAGIEAEMLHRDPDSGDWYARLVREGAEAAPGDTERLLEEAGAIPLPPYIDRAATAEDADRYQTVYAREPGAVAAPTAGLHFTDALFEALRSAGIERAEVTLHVGAGTFLPVTADDLDGHRMHSERYVLPESTVRAIEACRARGGRVIAVGTTSARVLESCVQEDSNGVSLRAGSGSTELFLRPGAGPRVIDGLLTNFHLPKSTLLMLVASFIGQDATLALYRDAVERSYRFYSYGDAMLLLSR